MNWWEYYEYFENDLSLDIMHKYFIVLEERYEIWIYTVLQGRK